MEGIDLERLENLIVEYLETVPQDQGEGLYDSYYGFAQEELGKFVAWLKQRELSNEGGGG